MAITRVTPDLIQVANNVTSTTVGNTTSIPSLTFDASGVIISATNTTVSVANTNITGNITSSQIQTDVVLQGNVTLGAVTFPNTDGTSGQVLQTNGSGVLSFTSPASYVFLSTADFSNTATADFTLPAGYDAYQFVFGNVIPVTDVVELYLRTSTDGGANYDLTDYDGVRLSATTVDASAAAYDITTASGAELAASVGSAAGEEGISGIFTIFHPHLANNTYFTWHFGSHNAAGRQQIIIGSGIRDTAADVDAVRFLFSSGNIESGTITLYGMKNS